MKRPASLIFFALAAGVLVLSMIPIVGFFAMALGAFILPGFLILVGMLSLVLEAYCRKSFDKRWLLLPGIYFLGYAIAYGYSHYEFNRLDNEVQQANSAPSITFNPEKDILYVTAKGYDNADLIAEFFVSTYGVEKVYSKSKSAKHGSHRFFSFASFEICKSIDQHESARSLGATTFGFRLASGAKNTQTEQAREKPKASCGYVIDKEPEVHERLFQVNIDSSQLGTWHLGVLRQSTATITLPDQSQYVLKSGSASTLSARPILFLVATL